MDRARPLKLYLGGAVVTVAYVSTTAAFGVHPWLIAAIGLSAGFVYALIATPLILGPETQPIQQVDPSPTPDQPPLFEMKGTRTTSVDLIWQLITHTAGTSVRHRERVPS